MILLIVLALFSVILVVYYNDNFLEIVLFSLVSVIFSMFMTGVIFLIFSSFSGERLLNIKNVEYEVKEILLSGEYLTFITNCGEEIKTNTDKVELIENEKVDKIIVEEKEFKGNWLIYILYPKVKYYTNDDYLKIKLK